MAWLRLINLAFAVWTLLTPMTHVLELPNKLALDATGGLASLPSALGKPATRWPRGLEPRL
jgi:hypothetical protein